MQSGENGEAESQQQQLPKRRKLEAFSVTQEPEEERREVETEAERELDRLSEEEEDGALAGDKSSNGSSSSRARLDPAEVFEADFFQARILALVDARSLAQSMLVSRRWLGLAKVDSLWQPLCPKLWEGRAHMPLQLLVSPDVPRRVAYAITLADLRRTEITPREACARTWTIRLKPTCGSYWTLLDPSQKGNPPLRRYFLCDGGLEADPNDPIWGGQESMWRIVYPKGGDNSQHVRINKWPIFKVHRTEQGGWYFENKFAIYSTVPDAHTVKSLKDRKWRCSYCARGATAGSSGSAGDGGSCSPT